MGHWRYKEENKTSYNWMKMKYDTPLGYNESSPQREVIAVKFLYQQFREISNNLLMHPEDFEKCE